MAEEPKKILVSHINIRQSIFFLLLRLVVVEVIAAFVMSVSLVLLFTVGITLITTSWFLFLIIPSLLTLVALKTFITFFIIFQWLNEYYEISAQHIIHRAGIMFRKEKKYALENVAFMEVSQGMFGRMFNYGTISLLNIRRFTYVDMYLIHNPMRYAYIIKELAPHVAESNILFGRNITEVDED